MIEQSERHPDETAPLWNEIRAAMETEIERRRERPQATARKKLDLPLERLSQEALQKFGRFAFGLEHGYAEHGFHRASALWELIGLEAVELYEERKRRGPLH